MKDTPIYPKRVFNCKGILLSFERPLVMGILNITPDSFYSGSRVSMNDELERRVDTMLAAGMDILDIGGYSSRPGAADVSEKEEVARVLPAIELLVARFPKLLISVDTFRSRVADNALKAGATIINDISGGALDAHMYSVVSRHQAPYVLMHMLGNPQTTGQFNHYENMVSEMMFYFGEKIEKARQAGIKDIILDPGFGFSKTAEQNFELFEQLHRFGVLNAPLLVGISRKSMIYKTLGISAEESLNGTTVLNTIALLKGASVLRVHDVAEAAQAIQLVMKTKLID